MENKQEKTKQKRQGGGGVFSKACVGTLCLALATPFLFAGCSGDANIKGTVWYQGTQTPTVTQGVNGDFYIDTDDFLLYQKVDGTWTIVMRDFGKKGADGSNGQNGQVGQQGVAGNGIASIQKTSTEGNVDTYTITFTDASVAPVTFTVTNGTNGSTGVAGAKGNGIANIAIDSTKSDATKTTYVITFDEGQPFEFEVKNGTNGQNGSDGVGIVSVAKTSSTGLIDLYTITYTNNTTSTFTVVNGKDGVGISDVEISFEYDNDGNEFAKITIKYDDASKADKNMTIPVPARVESIQLEQRNFAMQKEGKPQLMLGVRYQNDTYKSIPVTDNMIVSSNIDFTTVGNYYVEIKYQGKMTNETITVYDPENVAATSISANYSSIIMLVDSEGNLIQDYSKISMNVEYESGESDTKKLSDTEFTVDDSNFTNAEEPFNLNINGFNQTTTISVYPTKDLSTLTLEQSYYTGGNTFYLEKGSAFDNFFGEDDIIVSTYNVKGTQFTYVKNATATDFESALNTSEEIQTQLSLKNTTNGDITFVVYDPATTTLESAYVKFGDVIIGTNANDVVVSLSYRMANENTFSKSVKLNELTIVDSAQSWDEILNTAGEYNITVEYNGTQTILNITVCDPSVCNVQSIYLKNSQQFNFTIGTDLETWLQDNIVGQDLNVSFYNKVNGQMSKTVKVTRDMIDISTADFNNIGETAFSITYTLEGQTVGKSVEYYVTVLRDMTNATLQKAYTVGENFASLNDFVRIDVYDNGVAQFVSIDSETGNETIEQYEYQMVEGENLLMYKMPELNAFVYLEITNLEAENPTIDTYVPSATYAKTYLLPFTVDGETAMFTLKTVGDNGETYAIVGVEYGGTFMHMVTVKCTYEDATRITFGDKTYTINADESGATDGILQAE